MYRPCKSANHQLIEAQQLQYLRDRGGTTDPHDQFDLDLKQLIKAKLKEGHEIILMGDFNVPINKTIKFTKMLTFLRLSGVITKKYQADPHQSTYQYGSTIIDGIWTTDGTKKEQNTDKCPNCNARDEHSEHIIMCKDKEAESIFQTAFAEVGIWLNITKTNEIELAITDLILKYRNGSEDTSKNSEKIQQAMNKQQSIGLFAFMCRVLCSN